MAATDRDINSHPIHTVFMASAKKMRKSRGWAQSDVAEKIGMDQSKYSRLERTINFTPVSMDEAWKNAAALESSLLQMTFTAKLESWAELVKDTKESLLQSKRAMDHGSDTFAELIVQVDMYEEMIRSEQTEMGESNSPSSESLIRAYAAKQIVKNEANTAGIEKDEKFIEERISRDLSQKVGIQSPGIGALAKLKRDQEAYFPHKVKLKQKS